MGGSKNKSPAQKQKSQSKDADQKKSKKSEKSNATKTTTLIIDEAKAINYSWVVMIIILSIPILKQKIGMNAFLSIIISYFGVIVIATNGDLLSLQFDNPKGVIYALITTVIWALFWLFNTKH